MSERSITFFTSATDNFVYGTNEAFFINMKPTSELYSVGATKP